MATVLCRRNSMRLLSLYDLESFEIHSSMTEDKQQRYVLEDLPNELLISIFGFLSAYDLYRCFYNLNSRLNQICSLEKVHLDLTLRESLFDYYSSNQHLFTSNTYSLTLTNQHINIKDFRNLRRLTIKDTSLQNLNRMLSQLHTLPYLSFLNTYSIRIEEADDVLPILKLTSLKSLIFHSFDAIIFPSEIIDQKLLIKLEYLSIDACYFDDFLVILQSIGSSLKKIDVTLLYEQRYSQTSSKSMINEKYLLSKQKIPKFVEYLQITFNYLSLENFQLILRYFPYLKYLTFSTLTNEFDFISSTKWNSFISSHLLELKNLQFYIRIIGSLGNEIECPSNDSIEVFYENNKNWLNDGICMDFHRISKPELLEFYTCSQPSHDGKYSVELYGKQRIVFGKCKNSQKYIEHLKITLTDQLISNENSEIYPNIKRLTIHSRLTKIPSENDSTSKLILSDLIKSIVDLSKITIIDFTSSNNSTHPTSTFARLLLDKMPNISTLRLSNDYFLYLLNFPLIRRMFCKQIRSLCIRFEKCLLIPYHMIQIEKCFSNNLHFLYIQIFALGYLSDHISLILSILFSKNWKQLYIFNLNLLKHQQSTITTKFTQQFKENLQQYLLIEKQKRQTIQYSINDQEFSIHF